MSLRTAMTENFLINDITDPAHPRIIGEMDRFTAPMLLHPNAIYMHEGQTYQVEELDFDACKAFIRRVNVDYYTDADLNVSLSLLDIEKEEENAALGRVMLEQYMFVLGVTMITSSVNVYFRDLEHILTILSMAWMFMTPIMYDMSMVPEKLQPLFRLNPMTGYIMSYRDILYWGTVPDAGRLAISGAVGFLVMAAGFAVFGRLKRRFSEVM